MSTCIISVEGRNQTLFIERLKKSKISVLKLRLINNKLLFIEIKYKDMQKVFEISENMWYNTVVGYRGAKRVVDLLIKNAVIVVSALVLLTSVFILNAFVLTVDLTNVPKSYRTRVERIIKSRGIGPLSAFSSVDYDGIGSDIMRLDGVDYARAEKKGYSLFITVMAKDAIKSRPYTVDNITSDVTGVIKSMTVYRGRALKSVGDTVVKGEKLVDGSVTTINDEVYTGFCQALVVVESRYEEEFFAFDSGEDTVADLIAAARLSVYGEDAKTEVSVTPSGGRFIIKVTVYYSVVYGER